ncbi:hypothetical protein Hamer_G016148, partial [Homarus americanus]
IRTPIEDVIQESVHFSRQQHSEGNTVCVWLQSLTPHPSRTHQPPGPPLQVLRGCFSCLAHPTGFVGPVLRRVSQMFLGSSPFLWPTPETKRRLDIKKTESKLPLESKGASCKRPVTRSVAEGGTSWGDRAILGGSNSPRRAASVSSTSFQPFKYTRLQNDNNGKWSSLTACLNSQCPSETLHTPEVISSRKFPP